MDSIVVALFRGSSLILRWVCSILLQGSDCRSAVLARGLSPWQRFRIQRSVRDGEKDCGYRLLTSSHLPGLFLLGLSSRATPSVQHS